MWRSTATLLLALLVSPSFAQKYIMLGDTTACDTLDKAWVDKNMDNVNNPMKNVYVELWWEAALEHVGAALLRATVIASGSSTKNFKLRHGNHSNFNTVSSASNITTLTVEVALAPKIHVRLTPHAAASPACANASNWSFYKNVEKLFECQFTIPNKFYGEFHPIKHLALIYIPDEWIHVRDFEFLSRWDISNSFSHTQWNFMYTDRYNLTHFVREANHSFLFLDTDRWSDSPDVKIMQCAGSSEQCGTQVVSFKVHNDLLEAAKEFSKTIATFSPSLSDLQYVIELAGINNSTIEETACEWALNSFDLENFGLKDEKLSRYESRLLENPIIIIFVCGIDKTDLYEYMYLVKALAALAKIDRWRSFKFKLYHSNNCHDNDWLIKMLIDWVSKNLANEIAGIVLARDMAQAAAPIAELVKIPLITYDIGIGKYDVTCRRPAVRSAVGHVVHLERALRRLLADCGWRRLGILSDPTGVSAALNAALFNTTAKLVVREVNVTSVPEIRHALQEFLAVDARIFLVNAEAAMTAVILTVAQELNITRDAGFVWIVREYGVADNATAVLRPLSVSLSWRGEAALEASNLTILGKLETRWRGRPWPLHAGPIAQAIATIMTGANLYGNAHLVRGRSYTLLGFWNTLEMYDEYGISAPDVYIEQWGATPRPRILAVWRGNQWRESGECPADHQPPDDGSVRCFVPAGDPFHPTCRDALLFASTAFAVFSSTVFIFVTVRCLRQALTARDQRVKTALAERMLARRERVFAALAAHLVDRSELDLHQELGQGRFGVVRLGVLRSTGRARRAVVVAAKALREDASAAEESEFLREACTLAALQHEHVVRFIGVCVVDGPPLLLMEHAFYSDLLRYLQTRRYLASYETIAPTESTEVGPEERAFVSAEALTSLARQAALALAYISQCGLVHRDVRASNCLLDERRSLKLADFGLARATGTVAGEYACRRAGVFPVLWMAPESLASGVSSPASDVWSFGVLVFELVSLGRRPYGAQAPARVLQHVAAGGRPRLPWDASRDTGALVRQCWRRAPAERPAAARLAEWLAERPRALRPALATDLVEVDTDD